MRVLVAAMPFTGHVSPMVAVARALVRHGHHVVAYTGSRHGRRFVDVGAELAPWRRAPDFDDRDVRATFPEVGDGRGLRAVMTNLEHVFLRTGTGQARDILAAGPFDVLVSDHLAIGSALAGEASGTPWASVALVPLGMRSRDLPPAGMALLPGSGPVGRARDAVLRQVGDVLLRRLDRVMVEVRASVGLPGTRARALSAFYSPQLVVAHGVPALEYPRSDLPPQVHFVGQLSPPAGGDLPLWWPDVLIDPRPLVHVTQGTYDVDPADLLLPSMSGLAALDVRVVAATGGPPLAAALVPQNAHQSAFLPYDQLLPRTAAMVTNGGWGGVLAALAAGVPLVVAGGTLDKPEIARRVARAGAGLDLRTGRPSPSQVRRAVERVLAEPSFAARSRDIGRALTAAGGADLAAGLVEQLARTRRLVPRPVRDPWRGDVTSS